MLITANVPVSACDSLWIDQIFLENDGIYSELQKITANDLIPITITPRAIVHARQYENPAFMIRQFETTRVASWQVIISNKCDVEKLEKLQSHNNSILRKFGLVDKKVIRVGFAGAEIRAVLKTFSDLCDVPVEMSPQIKQGTKIWAASSAQFSCTDYLGLLTASGVRLILENGKIFAEKA